jgi:hypothetical protein
MSKILGKDSLCERIINCSSASVHGFQKDNLSIFKERNGAEGRTYNLTYMEERTSRFIVTDYRLICRC